ncbi:MAG: DUF4405 domain-containing protein [Chlorobiaceae bacterium]
MIKHIRLWATPLAAGTFFILTVTGVMMFFKIQAGYIHPVHEWLSWAMVIGVTFHTIVNWKTFTAYFARKPAFAIMLSCAIITALSVGLPASQKENPRMKMTRALESAKLAAVAAVAGQNSTELTSKLEKKGIMESGPDMTIHEIARKNGKKEFDVLGVIFE